jgi:hypothetical protein
VALLSSFLGAAAGLVIMTANAEEAALLGSMGAGSEVVFLGLFGMTMTIFACRLGGRVEKNRFYPSESHSSTTRLIFG